MNSPDLIKLYRVPCIRCNHKDVQFFRMIEAAEHTYTAPTALTRFTLGSGI